MPSYHRYGAYRLDVSGVADRELADRVVARMESIANETDGGDEWLLGQLGGLRIGRSGTLD